MQAQDNINPVDNQAQDEFENILQEENQDFLRVEVQKFYGDKISNEDFVSQTKLLLQTSEDILERFQHNDEKDDEDYAKEEQKAKEKGKK